LDKYLTVLVDSPDECAQLIKVSFSDLKLTSGILIGVPIPKEYVRNSWLKTNLRSQEADPKVIHGAIDTALKECKYSKNRFFKIVQKGQKNERPRNHPLPS